MLGHDASDERGAARDLAPWAGLVPGAVELVERRSAEAARELWLRAMDGEDLSSAVGVIQHALDGAAPDTAFFLACALRQQADRTHQPLPPVVVPDPLPDVTRRGPGWRCNSDLWTGSQPSWSEIRPGSEPQPTSPSTERCEVCAGRDTVRVFMEQDFSNAGRWLVWELRCRECGAYTLFRLDD